MTLPAKFVERVLRDLGGTEGAALCAALDAEPPVSVRLNPAKTGADTLPAGPDAGLPVPEAAGLPALAIAGRVPWSRDGRYLAVRPSFTLDPDFHAGAYYVQEASSQFVGHLLAAVRTEGARILDLCAAPGGKTTLYASLAGPDGLVVANEIDRRRASVLADNVRKWGTGNVAVTTCEPRALGDFEAWFDVVAVDAPCSGEGMFRKEAVAVTQHCETLVKQCAALGAQILDNAAACLAPGGEMIFSTCTFAPEEDEGQVAAFLQRHPEFTLADVFGNVDYSFGSPGEANRTGGLPLDVSKVRRIWPCQGGEGHFMARLVKAGTPRVLPAEGEYTAEEQLWLAAAEAAGKKAKGKGGKPAKTPDARSARRENARACREAVQGDKRSREAQAGETSPAQSLAAWHAFAGQYFPALVDRPAVVHGGGVLLPVPFPQTNLHVLRAGVFVGSVQKGRFVPEHHLFTAFGAQCVNREELTLDDPRCVEYLSGREVEARIAADGWCCVTVDGWPLGGGKVSGGRVKNHYPKALRLL